MTEVDEERLLDIKYSMALRVYAHEATLKKLFHHHVFVEARTNL